jgi:hypothetical protein
VGLIVTGKRAARLDAPEHPTGVHAEGSPPASPWPKRATPQRGWTRSTLSGIAGRLLPVVGAVVLGAIALTSSRPLAAAPTDPAVIEVGMPDRANERIDAALDRLLSAADENNGRVVRNRFQDQVSSLDPLARAVFDYVNYANPNGYRSLWGPAAGGDYEEGGLGLGFTMRPKHMTLNGFALKQDLIDGTKMLESDLARRKLDLADADLAKIAASLPGMKPTARYQAIADASERLLEHVRHQIEDKQRATGNENAVLSEDELLASLGGDDHLVQLIAQQSAGRGATFFAKELETIDARRIAYGVRVPDEAREVGEAQQNYLLVIEKRAQLEALKINVLEAMKP